MIELEPLAIAAACEGDLVRGEPSAGPGDAPARAMVDSRSVEPGDIFFGIPGERADGGAFAAAALDAGAWGAVVTPERARELAGHPAPGRLIAAADPALALQGLAAAWRGRLGADVIAITGSTGKTSTKDILLAMLAPLARTVANRQNYNTEIGLSLTLLEAGQDTERIVVEMAMRGRGQIAELCEIALPDAAAITNIGPVHLELLGSIEAVAATKAELISSLQPGSPCVIPYGVDLLGPHRRDDVREITFAAGREEPVPGQEPPTVWLVDLRIHASGARATVAYGDQTVVLETGFGQRHNVVNTLAALGVAHALGHPLADLAAGLREVRFSDWRGDELELPSGTVVVADCYNANPMSMRAALDHLSELAARRDSPRRVAVLGYMAELGPAETAYHEEIGAHAASAGVDVLVAVGDRTGGLAAGFGRAGEPHSVPDAAAAAALCAGGLVAPGDAVLVKGSRSVGLEHVVNALTQAQGADAPALGVER